MTRPIAQTSIIRKKTSLVGHAHCVFLPRALLELVGASSETWWQLDVENRKDGKVLTLKPEPLSREALLRAEQRRQEIDEKRAQSVRDVRAKKKLAKDVDKAAAIVAQAQETIRELDAAAEPETSPDQKKETE